jgi:hypothetical protein
MPWLRRRHDHGGAAGLRWVIEGNRADSPSSAQAAWTGQPAASGATTPVES